MTQIITEIGWNHMGDINQAKEMIKQSKDNGASLVKFQTWSVDRLRRGPWDDDGRIDIYNKSELTKEQHHELFQYSEEVGIPFFTSVFSIEDGKILQSVQTKRVKIASAESRNINLIKYCDETFDTIYLSTGTSNLSEIQESIKHIKNSELILLHCVSQYPLDERYSNLPKINSLKGLCNKVGYSDHTHGVEVSKISLEYNIDVIEKHFTLSNELPGRDNKFAILPHQLKELSDYIKLRSKVNVYHGDDYLECEKESREFMSGRFDTK